MSEKRKANQLSEEELEERENVAADFFTLSVKIRNSESRLKKMRAEQKALLAKYPYLANAVGSLHKGGTAPSSESHKKQRKDEDAEMKETPSPSAPRKSPRERIEARLASKAGEVAQAARQEHEAVLKSSKQDRH